MKLCACGLLLLQVTEVLSDMRTYPEPRYIPNEFYSNVTWPNMKHTPEHVNGNFWKCPSIIDCARRCIQHVLCGSFSYSKKERLCVWSMYTVYGPGLGMQAEGWKMKTMWKGK